MIRDFLFVRNEGIYVHVCGFTIRTDESTVMVDEHTFLMCVDGVKNLLFLVFFDIGVESTTLTSATTILDSDLLIDGAFEFKFTDEFKFFLKTIYSNAKDSKRSSVKTTRTRSKRPRC